MGKISKRGNGMGEFREEGFEVRLCASFTDAGSFAALETLREAEISFSMIACEGLIEPEVSFGPYSASGMDGIVRLVENVIKPSKE